ncbi:MAG TPA: hypothetical protein VIL48_21090 [Acidimicrobiales bacterium]
MPFTDQAETDTDAGAAVRTDGAGPPRRGWLGGAGARLGAPRGRVAGLVWFLSRHGRYGRALMLHEHVRERWRRGGFRGGTGPAAVAAGPGGGARPDGMRRHGGVRATAASAGGLVTAAVRFDGGAVQQHTVGAAVWWAALTGRLAAGRPRREAVVGAVAALLAAPVLALAAVLVGALCAAGLGFRALSAVGGSVRGALRGSLRGALSRPEAGDDPAAVPSRRAFDWTPS